jgi:hypothetical protein
MSTYDCDSEKAQAPLDGQSLSMDVEAAVAKADSHVDTKPVRTLSQISPSISSKWPTSRCRLLLMTPQFLYGRVHHIPTLTDA